MHHFSFLNHPLLFVVLVQGEFEADVPLEIWRKFENVTETWAILHSILKQNLPLKIRFLFLAILEFNSKESGF